jgi:hypothetical protein
VEAAERMGGGKRTRRGGETQKVEGVEGDVMRETSRRRTRQEELPGRE